MSESNFTELRVVGRVEKNATMLVKVRLVRIFGRLRIDFREFAIGTAGQHIATRAGFNLPVERLADFRALVGEAQEAACCAAGKLPPSRDEAARAITIEEALDEAAKSEAIHPSAPEEAGGGPRPGMDAVTSAKG